MSCFCMKTRSIGPGLWPQLPHTVHDHILQAGGRTTIAQMENYTVNLEGLKA